jgi:hypothetical protein
VGILPNPGFDAGAFDNAAFDCTLPSDQSADNSGVDRDRRCQEWYRCDRCGFEYPREKMVNQNGLNVCFGSMTNDCVDKPGYAVAQRQLDIPYEQTPEPLPQQDDEL